MFFSLIQARGHSTALSAGPPSPRRETCFATSNCTPGRSLSNAPCAATPAVDVTLWAGTCAHILVPASNIHTHSLTCELILYAPVYSIMLVGFSLLQLGFSLLLNLNYWGLLSRHGFSSNTLPCTLIRLHTLHMTFYSFTSGNLLIHFQFTCFTCRSAAQSLMCTSSVLYETAYLRK